MPRVPSPRVTVLGRPGCPDTAAVRATLDAVGVAYGAVALAGPDTEGCGYTSPTVRVAGTYGGPTVLVQPDPDALPARLALLGVEIAPRP